MMTRERYLYDKEKQAWLPDHEVIARRSQYKEATFNFSVYKGGFNHSLGGYCGSKSDEKALCNKIEDGGGDRPVQIGDAKLTNHGTRKDYN